MPSIEALAAFCIMVCMLTAAATAFQMRQMIGAHRRELAELRETLALYDWLLSAKTGAVEAQSLKVQHKQGTWTTDYDNRWCDICLQVPGLMLRFPLVPGEATETFLAAVQAEGGRMSFTREG